MKTMHQLSRAGASVGDFPRLCSDRSFASWPRARHLLGLLAFSLCAVAQAATYYVATNGSDTNSGTSSGAPFRTPAKAVSVVQAGDTVVFAAGNYGTLDIRNKNGTSNAPIVFRSTAGAAFATGSYESGYGIYVSSNSHIVLEGLTATTSLWGIMFEGVSNSEIRNCTATDVGQEAIHVRYASSYILIDSCTVSYTGRRAGATDAYQGITTEVYAEGIYIGTGAAGGQNDGTHHVTVRNCDIYRTRSEAIDMKRGLHNIVVEGNRIRDISTKVRAAINVMDGPTGSEYNYIIRNNKIWNVDGVRYDSDGIAIRIFGGGVECYNNVVWNCEYAGIKSEGAVVGLRRIYNNTVYNGGPQGNIWIAAGSPDVRNNIGSTLANNIASSGSLFVNAAGGDFHLASTATAAIDTGATLTLVATDIDGNLRPQGSGYDMGAYEFVQTAALPGTPTGLSAVAGDSAVSLQWNVVAGATSYKVKYGTTSGSYPNVVSNLTGTSHAVTGLTNGTAHYFVVSAVNSAGEGPNSAQVSATPTAALISETFSSANSAWTKIAGGTFSVTGGQLELTSPAPYPANNANGNLYIHDATHAGDFELSVRCRAANNSSSTWEDFSVVFNYVDINNYYYANFTASNDANCNGVFRLSGGTLTQLADFSGLISPGTFYDVTIRAVGNQITVFRGTTVVADLAVTGQPTSATRFGVGSKNDVCSFDDFFVDNLGGGSGSPVKLTIPGTSVTASTHDGNVPSNTVDGNLSTRWSADGVGQWIQYALGSSHTVAQVRIAFLSGDVRRSTFDVQVSSNGSTWTTIASNLESSGTTTALETFDVPDTACSYVRLVGKGNTINNWNSYTEVEIYRTP